MKKILFIFYILIILIGITKIYSYTSDSEDRIWKEQKSIFQIIKEKKYSTIGYLDTSKKIIRTLPKGGFKGYEIPIEYKVNNQSYRLSVIIKSIPPNLQSTVYYLPENPNLATNDLAKELEYYEGFSPATYYSLLPGLIMVIIGSFLFYITRKKTPPSV